MTRANCNVNRLFFVSVEARSRANVISTLTTLGRQAKKGLSYGGSMAGHRREIFVNAPVAAL